LLTKQTAQLTTKYSNANEKVFLKKNTIFSKKFFRSEAVAAHINFGPAIRSNTILPTLQSYSKNGITTSVGAIFQSSPSCFKRLK